MGLDDVEIALRIEQTFGVNFTREEWPYLFDSAGWLHKAICAKLDGRQLLIPDLFGIQQEIHRWLRQQPRYRWWRVLFTNGRIDAIVPRGELDRAWDELSEYLRCTLPALEYDQLGQVRLPAKCTNTTALARWCMKQCPRVVPPLREELVDAPLPSRAHWSDTQAWDKLKDILAETLYISPDLVTPDSRLVDDLGMS